MLLSVKKRKEYLKALGFYKGKVDSKKTADYKKAVFLLQKKYFMRKKDIDGEYGNNTDMLLRSAYNVRNSRYFKLSEFRCNCGHCTGYPAVLSYRLVKNLDYLRGKAKAPFTITSGIRCRYKNSRLTGSSATSGHMKGKAADVYCRNLTATYSMRRKLISSWYGFKGAKFAYGNTPNMGNAVHLETKW